MNLEPVRQQAMAKELQKLGNEITSKELAEIKEQ